jgi:hypothetical protein
LDAGCFFQADVVEVEATDFLDASPGVVKQEQEGAVAKARDGVGVWGLDEESGLVAVEILGLLHFGAGARQLSDSATAFEVLGSAARDVAGEALERCEPLVASAGLASALLGQPAEEDAHVLDVEYLTARDDLRRSLLDLAEEAEQEPEGVPVREDRVAAEVSLEGQIAAEEVLHQGRE